MRMAPAPALGVRRENADGGLYGSSDAFVPIAPRAVMHHLEDAGTLEASVIAVEAAKRVELGGSFKIAVAGRKLREIIVGVVEPYRRRRPVGGKRNAIADGSGIEKQRREVARPRAAAERLIFNCNIVRPRNRLTFTNPSPVIYGWAAKTTFTNGLMCDSSCSSFQESEMAGEYWSSKNQWTQSRPLQPKALRGVLRVHEKREINGWAS